MSEAGKPERCKSCGNPADRVYSFTQPKEFFAYDDAQYKCNISSGRQERKLMKAHKHVYTAETPFYNSDRMREIRKKARTKPMYFTSAGATKMDRS